MEFIDMLAVLSRWVHILSVITAIGGAVFMRVALLPAAEAVLSSEQHAALRARVTGRWKKVVHACVALLIVSGSFNFYLSITHGVAPMPYHAIFGIKFMMALGVFFLAIALNGTSPGFAQLRAQGKKWLGVLIALAVLIVMMSGVLRSIHTAALTAATG